MGRAINISKQLEVRGLCANIDALYGPYDDIAAACLAIPAGRRVVGRTVGILSGGSVVEYWWKSGIQDSDLVQKVEQLMLSLYLMGESSFTKNEGDSIYGQFMVDGGAGIKKALLYQVINDTEIYVQEYTGVGKKSPYTFSIPNPGVSGIYTYRIKVLDSLDNYAITGENVNYIEYTLYYGGISTVYNLTNFNAITVKNFSSIAGVPFQLNIAVRDSTFRISSVCLTDKTDEDSDNLSIELTPSTGNYIGNNTYYMPNTETLEAFNGKKCSIVVTYVEVETVKENIKDLFRLLDIGTLEIIPEYEGGNYYATLPGYYVFQLQSGVENISVVLTPGNNSDFNFERSTVLAYRRFSLRVLPNDIEKSNAQIVINYYYIYNNVEYTGSFTRIIGNILALPEQSFYNPTEGTTTVREDLVYADSTDYTGIEDGQYYKVISEDVTFNCLSSSFILDTYCKINQQNDKSINYITITYGGVTVTTVTEDEISCANQWRNLYTDMPLNEWAQIGIGVNLQETFNRNGQDTVGYYHCIYINGMVVKTVAIGLGASPLTYNSNNKLVVTIGNGILVQKSFLYYKNDGSDIIYPNTLQNNSIIYNNFCSHKLNFSEPDNLPTLKFLRITDSNEMATYFNMINTYKAGHDEDKITHLTTFGTIGAEKASTMAEYDPNADLPTIESNATLFRQSVDIKKEAQKPYAVLCKAMWMGREYNNIVVEVHTQGTSTLVYPVPNFKFTFWEVVGNEVRRYCPEFIETDTPGVYFQESIYTAKADFMDSSHLNNTPTCNYYNALIQNLNEHNPNFTGSPSARNGGLDAIMGFPIIMEISDNANDFGDIFTNIGSFMLNIDKTGDSLGFEVDDNGEHLSCISFEGTSNDNKHGAAGRFDISEGITLKNYTNASGEINEAEIISDYNFVKTNIINPKKSPKDTIEYEGNTILASEHPYVKWCTFLSDGLEYRYPDSDIYKEKNKAISKVMPTSDFIKLYKMWWWVYKSDSLSQSDYKSQFIEHFDLYYCMIYFINLMTYAQTDNLGKNAMFDCWDGKHWYPRPYDLDSEAGLDNNGNDNIAPFVEIKPVFSLNYDPTKANDYDWLADNYLIDDDMSDEIKDKTGLKYPASIIHYGNQDYDRYHFSSNKSKLWINFYKNFKTEIETFYNDIRSNYGYSPEAIIKLCEDTLINKLGTAQYNQDFQNKYLATSDQNLAYGNRWYKFKKWLFKRFSFCDSYFGASQTAMYNITSRINYTISVDAPQYVAQQYQGESNRDTRFVLDNVSFSAGSGAATKITLLVNQPSVFQTSLFKYVTYQGGARNYNNLISLDVSGNNNSLFTNITTVTGESLDNLKYLNISNSAIQNVSVPLNVKTLLAENVNLNTLVIPDGCAVEEISLQGSTISGSVDFSSLPNLKRLNLTDCTFINEVTFANIPQIEELIMTRTVFKGTITISDRVNVASFDFSDLNVNSISFSGTDLQIDTLNFRNTKFEVDILNINAIRKNIKNLYFDNCQGLKYLQITDGGKFENLYCLSLYGSSINALGENNAIFDCIHFNNMQRLKKARFNADGTISYVDFNFQYTFINQITNITWNGTGANLFRDCQQLVSIGGTLNLTASVAYLFYRCYVLTTLPTINISNDVTSAAYIFANANALSYSSVESVIRKCTKVNNFTGALQCKQFNSSQTISLTTMFANNSANTITLDDMFSMYTLSGTFRGVSNNIVISGTLPAKTISAAAMFYSIISISIPYNLLSNATNLTSTAEMFAYSSVTFTGENRPTQTDQYGSVITLTNSVNKNFFCNSITNMSCMFYGSNVITNDATLFANLLNLTNANGVFGRTSVTAFSFTNSKSQTEIIPLLVDVMWANNPALTDISGCFANVYSVYCNNLVFHNNITSSRTINMSGLFGLANDTYRTTYPISIDLDGIVPNIIVDGNYTGAKNNSYKGIGTFQNRSVIIITTPTNSELFGKLNNVCRNTFYKTILYLPSTATKFNLRKVITSCSNMFFGCRLYTYSSEENHTYTYQDRKFVDVILPASCGEYSSMFRNSSVLKSLPVINSSGASNFSYMYYGCVINTPNLELPSDYFAICAGSLSNTSYMFAFNMYLTTLEYKASKGLFEGCTNLSNVTYMFYGASFLHKGVPVNLFGSTPLPRVTSLAYMFGLTSIIYDVDNESYKWFNASTIAPLINLDNISGLFYRNKINFSEVDPDFSYYYKYMRQTVENAGVEVAVIDPNSFAEKTFTNITKLFEHTVINPPVSMGGFRFMGFTIGTDAFFSSSVSYIDPNFVDSLYVSSIANANRMFYQSPTGALYTTPPSKTVTNLSNFVDNLSIYPNIQKSHIAGNLTGIASPYSDYNVEANAIIYYGCHLQKTTTPETWPSDSSYYPRYDYAV